MVRLTPFMPWEYRADAGFVNGTELTGYTVVAVDGDIGLVEAEYDGRPAYLDVDVGSWLFGHQLMLPAGLVERIDATERKVYVDRTRDQIEHAPRLDQAVTDRRLSGATWVVTTPTRTCRRVIRCDLSLGPRYAVHTASTVRATAAARDPHSALPRLGCGSGWSMSSSRIAATAERTTRSVASTWDSLRPNDDSPNAASRLCKSRKSACRIAQ